VSRRLFEDLRLERARVRLLGVGVSNLGDATAARQLSLEVPEAVDPRWEELDHVVDRVSERFGDVGVSYASLLDEDEVMPAPTREDRG
jgi:DNA polymerase IV